VEHLQEDCKSREEALPHEYSAISTPMSSTPIECEEMYLPTIDEDKETVYSYHSHHISNGHVLELDALQRVQSNDDNGSETDRKPNASDHSVDSESAEDIGDMVTVDGLDAKAMESESGAFVNGRSLRHDDSEYVYSSESGTEEEESTETVHTLDTVETLDIEDVLNFSMDCNGIYDHSQTPCAFGCDGMWREKEWTSTMGFESFTGNSCTTSLRITQCMNSIHGFHGDHTTIHWKEGDMEELRTLFSRFGSVQRIDIDGVCAVVEYQRIEDARQCMEEGHVLMWNDRRLSVERM